MAEVPSALQIGGKASEEPSSNGAKPKKPPTIAITEEDDVFPRKRYSYPAQVSPPVGGPLYNPLALPSAASKAGAHTMLMTESTEYKPATERLERTHSVNATIPKPSRTHSFLSRFNSIRSTLSWQDRYNEVDEDENGPRKRQRGLHEVQGEDEDGINFDVSGFEGPIALRPMRSKKEHTKSISIDQDDVTVAGLMAEFHRLEAEPRSQGAIGEGMSTILDTPFGEPQRIPSTRHRRELSDVEARNAAEEAQKHAEKTGGIVAVTEIPAFDLSHFEGGAPESRDVLKDAADEGKGDLKSYYFPPDPDMPNWRPKSMHWPYICLLISIALFFAGIQEYLLQISVARAKHNDGLIKFVKATDISLPVYFAWKYMPTLILVSYGVMWQITDFEVKRLEPFHHLSRSSGATAAESLNMDYLTFLQYFVPIKAVKYRQWAVFFSSVGTLLATSLVPVLQSAAVNMEPDSNQRRANEPKFVRVDAGWSRALTISLILVALCGIALLFKLERRKSGLLSDPKGIAGIAAMATRSHILNEFRNLDTSSNQLIHKQIRERRYILHKSSLWQGEFIRHPASTEEIKPEHPHPIMLRLEAGIPYIISLLLFIMLIPIFMFVPRANVVTEKLPWLLTTIATVLKLIWSTMEMDTRMIEPFYLLSRRAAPARTLTLDYTGTMPGVICVKAWLNKHYLVALVGLCSLLTEVLTVCVSSFDVDGSKFLSGTTDTSSDPNGQDNSQETFRSFWISFALSTAILILLMAVAALVYLRRRHKFLPREPGTIASVLAFIHQSRMLVDFVGTEMMNSRQMTRYLEGIGKTYGLGWFSGRDGDDHCGVDEEPLLSDYKYGVDWRKSRLRANHIGTWEVY